MKMLTNSLRKRSPKLKPGTGYFSKPMQDLADDATSYLDLEIEKVKLQLTKGLSLSLGEFTALLLVIFSISIVLLALAAAGILLLGKWTGSYIAGAFIMAGLFAVVSAVLFVFRKKLFINTFVQMFAQIFFDNDSEEEKR